MVEEQVLDTLRARFQLHGFVPIETRGVEPLEQLAAKGETDKEIYVLRRLHAGDNEGDIGLGLHFDLTVPFARYVVEQAGKLSFPLRRYQIQKAWRGERPQEGRYREFLQADFDIIGQGSLPFHYDVELPLVLHDVWAALPLPPLRVHVNNRKINEGLYRSIGIKDIPGALRAVDKLDKVGERGVSALLIDQVGCTGEQARMCLELARISSVDGSFAEQVRALGVKDSLLEEGLSELTQVVEAALELTAGGVVADLRIARGLDYYTGTVYETVMEGHEALGSVCSGGRYDSLASADNKLIFPGVGLSIGVTRILARLFGRNLLRSSRKTPTCVLVALPSEQERSRCNRLAAVLRGRGIPTEVAADPARYGKQIRFAERRGIPYVWFPHGESGGNEVRDIRTGIQEPSDPEKWLPPVQDLHVTILVDEAAR
jgi:histidyl-tRNA synthetase